MEPEDVVDNVMELIDSQTYNMSKDDYMDVLANIAEMTRERLELQEKGI